MSESDKVIVPDYQLELDPNFDIMKDYSLEKNYRTGEEI